MRYPLIARRASLAQAWLRERATNAPLDYPPCALELNAGGRFRPEPWPITSKPHRLTRDKWFETPVRHAKLLFLAFPCCSPVDSKQSRLNVEVLVFRLCLGTRSRRKAGRSRSFQSPVLHSFGRGAAWERSQRKPTNRQQGFHWGVPLSRRTCPHGTRWCSICPLRLG
jgi:hypothetical protein